MYLDEAKQILNNEYQTKYFLAQTSKAKAFMDEKIKHSYQVLGTGNFLLRHEFAQYSKEDINYYQSIVLLHDVYRFQEALEIEKGNNVDHGICGAKYLEKTKSFNKQDAMLAIKHHGHLIERLYEDDTYRQLSRSEQERIKQIAFLVRDADKLANYHLLATHLEEIKSLFFVEKNNNDSCGKNVSPKVMADFMAYRCINKADVKNVAEHALMIMAWVYDMNFTNSFVFLEKLHIFEKLFTSFAEFWLLEDIPVFQKTINGFIKNRMTA